MPAPQPEPLRFLIVANKAFECEPLVSALLARDARPLTLSNFVRGYDPAEVVKPATEPKDGCKPEEPPQPPPEADGLLPRARLPIRPRLTLAVAPNAIAEVWCIEDWMRKQCKVKKPDGPPELVNITTSSSFEKFTFTLPQIKELAFGGKAPTLVIGFGTAGIPSPESMNGCVAVGTRVYIHDPWAKATENERAAQEARFGPLLKSPVKEVLEPLDSPQLSGTLFLDMSVDVRYAAEARFLRPPVEPAALPRILAGHGFASLGTINVCNYDDYVWADEETLQLFEKQVRQREIGSMETTHGLIRLTWPQTAFVFVSGLTDRVPLFNAEVGPRVYAQNFAAAHNAGVTAAFLLTEFARLDGIKKLFV